MRLEEDGHVDSILSSTGLVADVAEPLDPEVAEQARVEAVEIVKAKQARLDVCNQSREGFNVGLKECRIKRVQMQTAVAHELINCGGPNFEPDGIAAILETITKIDQREQIFLFTLKVVTEQETPLALAELRRAEADLKDAAAAVIDSRRWARLREHSSALEALVESEGDTVVRPQRFQEEAAVANELRMEAVRLRDQALEIEKQLRERKG